MGSFWSDTAKGIGSIFTGGASDLRQSAQQSEWERQKGKELQLAALAKMNVPTTNPINARRIAALDEESQPVAFSQDPTIQGERAQLLGGGAKALSSIQNQQHAYGLKGGFANVGSPQDVQDRMSVALSQLGEKAQANREAKRNQAADLAQGQQDTQAEWGNARQRAIAAIEAGDVGLALQNLQQASALQQQSTRGIQDFWGNIISSASKAGSGGASGAPAAAKAAGGSS